MGSCLHGKQGIFIQIITQWYRTWKPGLMWGWDVFGNDCYIMEPPGELCLALLGGKRELRSYFRALSDRDHTGQVCSAHLLRLRVRSCWPSSALNFPYLLAVVAVGKSRCTRNCSQRMVTERWKIMEMNSQCRSGTGIFHVLPSRKVIAANAVY